MYRQLTFFLNEMPFAFWSAAAFYAIAAAVCAIPGVRRRFTAVFTPPAPSSHTTLAPLDSLRGFAALWVFSFHIYLYMQPVNNSLQRFGFVRSGPMAVSYFAVLSGFLVYRSIRGKTSGGGSLAEYARRRFLRIYPLYLVSLILGTAVLKMTVGNFGELGVRGYVADVFMLRAFGYPNYFGMPRWNPPVWSLYCEVMFYCLLPLFVSVARRRILTVSIAGFLLTSLIGSAELGVGFILLAKFFFMGVILCELFSTGVMERLGKPAPPLFFAAGVALLYFACNDKPLADQLLNLAYEKAFHAPGPYTDSLFSISVALSAGLIFTGALGCKPISWVFSLYPFRFIGIVSYSIYLLHTAIIRIAMRSVSMDTAPEIGDTMTLVLIFIPMILLYSSVSYAVIERAFLRLKNTGRSSPA